MDYVDYQSGASIGGFIFLVAVFGAMRGWW